MSTRLRLPVLRHLAAYAILSLLDLHRALRRVAGSVLMRTVAAVLGVMLLGLVLTSLVALRRVAQSTQTLTSDAMIGAESAVAMRSVVREAQLQLLRARVKPGGRFEASAADRLEADVGALLAAYRRGVKDAGDASNAVDIEGLLEEFLGVLGPVTDGSEVSAAEFAAADAAARRLVDAVEAAYQVNRERMRLSATRAQDSAERALRVARWMWGVVAVFIVGCVLAYAAARWLTVPEDPNS